MTTQLHLIYAPKDTTLPNGMIIVSEITDTTVQFCSFGGGWVRKMTPQDLSDKYRKVEPEELKAIEYYAAEFDIEDYFGDRPAKGYTKGMRTNGWANPVFDQEGIDRIREVFGSEEMSYDKDRDVLVIDLGDDVDDECRFEEYQGFDIYVDGQLKHVYPIGSGGGWTWDEVSKDDE
ncbi:hypothetical protein AWH63_10900 [Marinobacter sp. C18]|uniref:hypothetical protein n=1 Tax=Marinobacter sp. C18 TaxID=1772288 RepID=UPI000948F85F|nr:hypothetical protein [Marinobacter sp. C18]OLF82039.1 hypothetical protein AWH63_10900 [Marinobacter sp. C18]